MHDHPRLETRAPVAGHKDHVSVRDSKYLVSTRAFAELLDIMLLGRLVCSTHAHARFGTHGSTARCIRVHLAFPWVRSDLFASCYSSRCNRQQRNVHVAQKRHAILFPSNRRCPFSLAVGDITHQQNQPPRPRYPFGGWGYRLFHGRLSKTTQHVYASCITLLAHISSGLGKVPTSTHACDGF